MKKTCLKLNFKNLISLNFPKFKRQRIPTGRSIERDSPITLL